MNDLIETAAELAGVVAITVLAGLSILAIADGGVPSFGEGGLQNYPDVPGQTGLFFDSVEQAALWILLVVELASLIGFAIRAVRRGGEKQT